MYIRAKMTFSAEQFRRIMHFPLPTFCPILAVAVLGGLWVGISGASVYEVVNTERTGSGSLWQAITDANANAGMDTVEFNIPGPGPHTISPGTASLLPQITDPVVIDGYTQPGAVPASDDEPANLMIELDGSAAIGSTRGLSIRGGDCTIRGLCINKFYYGIALSDSGGNVIEGNHIGANVAGTEPLGNRRQGVYVTCTGNRIGGATPEARNVISGNAEGGISISTGDWDEIPGEGNEILGNYIGTDARGSGELGNGYCGITIRSGADNAIGGTGEGTSNIIAFNEEAGVFIARGVRNAVLSNSIHSNGRLGIDLMWDYWDSSPDGVNPNDEGDVDWGANDLQNFPVLTSITSESGATTLEGSLNSTPNAGFRIEFFLNLTADFTGYGEGEALIGSAVINTDASGNGSFKAVFSYTVPDGAFVAATATDALGNTSEFSQCMAFGGSVLVTNALDEGIGSLRNAITVANLCAGVDTIRFEILGLGPHTITLLSALPTISDPVVIDGYSQNGSMPATSSAPATLMVEIDGSQAGTRVSGLTMRSGYTTIKGLAITGFTGFDSYGIKIDAPGNNVIEGNHIGTDLSGSIACGNWCGIAIRTGSGNRIGGTTEAARNVISGNSVYGILVSGGRADIQGNYMGTDASGATALGNGIGISLGDANTVGGADVEGSNVISGNLGHGVHILGSDNLVEGNIIGLDASGMIPMGNGGSGVHVGGSSAGASSGASARDRFAMKAGEKSGSSPQFGQSSKRNGIFGNCIFSNGCLGIDIEPPGVNVNDPGDLDTGPNDRQNFPTWTSVISEGDSTTFQGTLNSLPNTTYRIDLYYSRSFDPSGFGEGEVYVGSGIALTDALGDAVFSVTLPGILPENTALSCTATDPVNNTSEFSQCIIHGGSTLVTNADDDGPGSLRFAIHHSNATAGVDTVAFSIPGEGPHTIAPLSSFPVITDPLVIDGYSQAGAAQANADQGATLMIELDGSLLEESGHGLDIISGNCTVRGLAINRFPGDGMHLSAIGGNVVEGNHIGTDVSGATAMGNGLTGVAIHNVPTNRVGGANPAARNVISGNALNGIHIEGEQGDGNVVQGNYIGTDASGLSSVSNSGAGVWISSADNLIGGLEPCTGNVISGNAEDGIIIAGSAATGNIIHGNYVGTDRTGMVALGNGSHGILVRSESNLIGGPQAGARNIISGNSGAGVKISYGSAKYNAIQGNYIGTDITRAVPLGNSASGVTIQMSFFNAIGGPSIEEGNLIAFNAERGIEVLQGTGNTILSNLVMANGALGIDLGGAGVSPNDQGDSDSGPNELQNFPDLVLAETDSVGNLTVDGLLHSTPNTTFVLQFFLNSVLDSTGFGEGEKVLGDTTVITDANGDIAFATSFVTEPLTMVEWVTATATDPEGNTSEFSLGIAVEGGASAPNPAVAAATPLLVFPNPSEGLLNFRLFLESASPSRIRVYNIAGELVKTVLDDVMKAGSHEVVWNCRDTNGKELPTGVYFYVVTAHDRAHSGKVILKN